MEAIVWLAVAIVLLVVEIITLGLTTIWFAGGALVACVAAALQADFLVQMILFLVVSVVMLFFTRPVAMRYMNKNRTKTNSESLVGKEAVVLQEINNLKAAGQVQVNGIEWTARAEDMEDVIEKGAIVCIKKIEGVKLIVKRKEGK
ncbi:MAG: NfeD family protein [Eubacterium sp.]|nr:NfeD family protein [Eubacterium sp.]